MRWVVFLCLCLSICCQAQIDSKLTINTYESPYALSWRADVPILSLSTALVISQFINKDRSPIPEAFIENLDVNKINSFDKAAAFNYSHKAGVASDYLLFGSMSAPILLLADAKIRKDWKQVALISSETFLVGMSLTMLGKNLSTRSRPFLYNSEVPIDEKLGSDGRNSFFSGHTSMTALSTFMMAKIITDYHPDSKYKPLIWTTATVIPLTTGMLRYRAGKHFLTDVMAGFTVGALTGYLIPHLHQSVRKKRDSRDQYTIDHNGKKIRVEDFFVDSVEF